MYQIQYIFPFLLFHLERYIICKLIWAMYIWDYYQVYTFCNNWIFNLLNKLERGNETTLNRFACYKGVQEKHYLFYPNKTWMYFYLFSVVDLYWIVRIWAHVLRCSWGLYLYYFLKGDYEQHRKLILINIFRIRNISSSTKSI